MTVRSTLSLELDFDKELFVLFLKCHPAGPFSDSKEGKHLVKLSEASRRVETSKGFKDGSEERMDA